nr:similar to CG12948 [Papilio xuthus]
MSILFNSAVCIPALESEYRPFIRSMSATGLTSQAQLQYILQWFQEFSEYQREDFLPVLAAACSDKPDQLAATLSNLSCQDKPVSLFQCRIKLFNEWYPTWTEEERERLVNKISEIDAEFSMKLQEAVLKGIQVNGNDDEVVNDGDAPEKEEKKKEIEETVEEDKEFPSPTPDNISIEITAAS